MREFKIARSATESYYISGCENIIDGEELSVGTPIREQSCELSLLTRLDAKECRLIPIQCPEEEIKEIIPGQLYIYLNKSTEVSLECNGQKYTNWHEGGIIIKGEKCTITIGNLIKWKITETNGTINVPKLDIKQEKIEVINYHPDFASIKENLNKLEQTKFQLTLNKHGYSQHGLTLTSV